MFNKNLKFFKQFIKTVQKILIYPNGTCLCNDLITHLIDFIHLSYMIKFIIFYILDKISNIFTYHNHRMCHVCYYTIYIFSQNSLLYPIFPMLLLSINVAERFWCEWKVVQHRNIYEVGAIACQYAKHKHVSNINYQKIYHDY